MWANKYDNDGDPPESFVERFCSENLEEKHSKDKIGNKFRFKFTYLSPFIDTSLPQYGTEKEAHDRELEVATELYSRTIKRRRAFVFYLIKRRNNIEKSQRYGQLKGLVKYLAYWSNCVFYEDDELLRYFDEIRRVIIRSYRRDYVKIIAKIDEVIEYLLSSEVYPLEMPENTREKVKASSRKK